MAQELTQQEIDQVLHEQKPPLRKPIDQLKDIAQKAGEGLVGLGAGIANFSPRPVALKQVTI